ncbi:acetylesterase [Bifidobacterium ramosum]|uniref:Acetylesterase n=1 Tax=Bifidobacterium ramosum TaxID=1798158 RepID=A0A6L4X0N6_9BIFI|nr:alpha/beta hydrolase [Bifidobacterium ramosum]KAB8288395.1 acetylesterase [Bifidobacterium ramosum]NEG71570.1 alpha/beta hydrolase fold domain-containing protein [Bifidobacterium ramosum]
MHYIDQTITGIDGTQAQFTGYVIDNNPEVNMDRQRPAVLVLPGGGYETISYREGEPIALAFVGAGYHAFMLRYSCKPSVYPTALCEAAEAMRLIREHAGEWHVDPGRVAVIGFSAGGHLAENLATSVGDDDLAAHGYDPDAVRPNALMLGYPVVTSGALAHRGSFDALLGDDRKDDPAWLDKLSIEKHIDEKTPPVFVWTTVTDDCVPMENTMMLVSACKEAGVPIEAHLYPEGVHGLALGTKETAWDDEDKNIVPCVQSWIRLAIDWIGRLFLR